MTDQECIEHLESWIDFLDNRIARLPSHSAAERDKAKSMYYGQQHSRESAKQWLNTPSQ